MTPAQAHVKQIVQRSGTSFGMAMRLMPSGKRHAMYAIYAFCREIDDIADEPGTEVEKRRGLAAWRTELDAIYQDMPCTLTGEALAAVIDAYDLPKSEFVALIEGMLMDVDLDHGRRARLDHGGLQQYCRRVAGAVGLLSIHVFGAPQSRQFALAMGDALQLTNILRDIGEDADRGRIYLPMDMIHAQGIEATEPSLIVRDPRLRPVCEAIAAEAVARFRDADELASEGDRRLLKPALIMGEVYRGYLDRMLWRGFEHPTMPVQLSKLQKAGRALRALTG